MSLDDLEVSECAYCEVPYGSPECIECPMYEDEYPDCYGQYNAESKRCQKCVFQNECKDWSEDDGENECSEVLSLR